MSSKPDSTEFSLPLPALERIDNRCLEFEAAWKAGEAPRIEDYLGDAQGAERGELLRQLLLLDLDYRRLQAEEPTVEEYRGRFSDDGEIVADVFGEFSMGAASSPPPGTRVRYFGDYELLEEIGHGGMGVVYKARQVSLNRVVALKMILSVRLTSQAAVNRFRAEAETAANLQHPNIVAVHEVGVHNGQQYFSMDYVDGQNLAEMVRENPLSANRAAQYVRKIAEAIHYAHEQGTLHRDLKPSNVLIDTHDEPRVTDFGLAKRMESDHELTGSSEILGTPSYMAPEQAEGQHERVGSASDVYSLGAVLYELLTGRPPFRAATSVETLRLVIDTDPVSPRLLNPQVPRDLETICLKSLEKEPRKRYGSAVALADDLGRFLRCEPIEARPIGRAQRLWRWCRRKPVLAAVSSFALIAACATVIALGVSVVSLGRLWRAERALRAASERQAAALFFERTCARCTPEYAAQGMLWLARSLQMAATVDDPELESSVRLQLAAWSRDLPRLDLVVSCPVESGVTVLSPDEALLAIGMTSDESLAETHLWNAETHLWNVATGQALPQPVPGLPVAFLPDGKTLLTMVVQYPEPDTAGWDLTGSSQSLQLNDVNSGQAVGTPLEMKPLSHCVMSPDGKSVCIATVDIELRSSFTRLLEVGTWKAIGSGSMEPAIPLSFAEDGKTLAMLNVSVDEVAGWGDDRVVFLVDVASGKRIGTPVTMPSGLSTSILGSDFDLLALFLVNRVPPMFSVSPDAKTIAMLDRDGDSHWVVLADLETGETTQPQARARGSRGNVALGPNGETLTVASDGNARLWDVRSWQPLGLPLPRLSDVTSAAFVASESLILTVDGRPDEVRLWRVGPAAAGLHHIKGITNSAVAVVFSPDTKTVLLCDGSDWILYERSTGKARRLCCGTSRDQSWAFSCDGQRLVRWRPHEEGRVEVWDVAASTLVHTLAVDGKIGEAAFMPDPNLLVIQREYEAQRLNQDQPSNLAEVQVWDAATGKPVGPSFGSVYIVVSPDGPKVLSPVAQHPRSAGQVWDLATRKTLGPPLVLWGYVTAVAFSPDGSTVLAVSSDNSVRCWDASTGEPGGRILEHQGRVDKAVFSPDGRLVLTVSPPSDGDVRAVNEAQLWDIHSGSPVGPPLRPKGDILDVAFTPDGKAVLAATVDNVIFRWDITPLQATPERILLWTEVMTGMELDASGEVRVLDTPTWHERRRRLEAIGGPVIP